MYSRTASDSLKLRRLITSMKETGSDLASHLEDQSASFFTGVQVVRSNNANRVRFDSDEEDNDEFSSHTETIRRHRGKGHNPNISLKEQRTLHVASAVG